MKKSMLAWVCLLSAVFAAPAFASRTVQQGFDETQCANGACTVLRVTIDLDSSKEDPIYNQARNSVIYGNDRYTYDTVIFRAADTCTKAVIVPEDVFFAIAAVFRTIAGVNGTPPPVLTPTQQTLLLFYTTLLQQTQGFECAPRDLNNRNGNNGNNGNNGIPIPPPPGGVIY